jgi:trimeric autotransporter adhesin
LTSMNPPDKLNVYQDFQELKENMHKNVLFLLAYVATMAVCAVAQGPIIGTIAGGGRPGAAATAYSASGAIDVALDSSGNVYVAVSELNQIWVISPSGAVTEVIGNGSASFSGDGGPAISAGFNNPTGVALDSSGNLYIADQGNSRIRKVTAATGVVTTVAGTGVTGYSGDLGPATRAEFYDPTALTLDSIGNLYIADRQNNVIREVDATTGIIRTVAGNAALTTYSLGSPFGSYSGDGGPATSAGLDQPSGVAVDLAGNIYIADSVFTIVRKVTAATGIITTVAGNGHYTDQSPSGGDGGPATSAAVYVNNVTVDAIGNLYIAGGTRVRMVSAATGIINTVAGNQEGSMSSGDGGPATAADLNASAVAVDPAGNLYIADEGNNTIRKVTAATGIISTLVGNNANSYSGDGGPAVSAQLNTPRGVALDAVGEVYIADTANSLIRAVAPATGIIRTVAGHYAPYGPVNLTDGIPATQSSLAVPSGIALDSSGNLYIADSQDCRVRKVTAGTGIITTIAGGVTNAGGFPEGNTGDGGPATSSQLNGPSGVAAGNVFIADTYNMVIRVVSAATGIINRIAGGSVGYVGDGGPAILAGLKMPTGVALDSAGNLYIADQGNNAVRKVAAATSIITTIAGNGVAGYSGDGGPAARAQLNQPASVAVDSNGNVYIADEGNSAIRKVTAATGIITTMAGNGTLGFSGDGGPATAAELAHPFGVATGPGGRVYVADTGTNRIRAIPGPPATSSPLVSPAFAGGQSVSAGATAVLTFPIKNTAPDQAATGVSFNSALSSGLVVATPNGLSGSCGTVSAVEGSRGVTVSGVDLAPGGTCTFSLHVATLGVGVQYATAPDLVSGGNPVNFFALADVNVEGAAAVIDGASFEKGTVTPNGILTYFGPVGCTPDEQVLVNGAAAAILFSNATQINFVSPGAIAGNPATIQLVCNGSPTVTLTAPAAVASPSLFTETGTGTGQGSIVNLDGTVNSAANPVTRGSYISVYGTGFGALNPTGADGLRHLAAAVQATIGGANSPVIYAGEAPGETSGLQQINLQVPAGIAAGLKVEIVLAANDASTQPGVTVAVK